METTAPFSFISEFVERLLETSGIELTDDQKIFYIPQLSAMAEQRLGKDLMAKLSASQLEEFEKLFSNPDTTDTDWNAFWNRSIPNFSDEVEATMRSFGDRVKELLARTA